MSKRRHLSDLLDANGDVKSGHLDNVPASDNASALTSGTLPAARIGASSITNDKMNLGASTTSIKLPSGTAAQQPSGNAGEIRYDTTKNAVTFHNGTTWMKISSVTVLLNTVTGSIIDGTASTLTLAGEGFLTANLVVNFTQSSDSIDVDVTVTPTSDTAATVAVPASVYNNVTAGNVVVVKVTNSDNSESAGVNKTAITLPTGGTITTHGSYRVHTFLSSGNYVVPSGFSATHDTLLVAGGGAGGNWHAGGGGAGGMFTYQNTPSAATYAVVVGGGGAGGTSSIGSNGADSTVFSQTAVGGGRGGNYTSQGPSSGGSGGGGNGTTSGLNAGASGTSGQGNSGGNGSGNHGGGGGGGKGASGSNSPNTSTGGTGGAGGSNDYRTGSNVTYAGGGGGGTWGGGSAASGGSGGGGNGSYNSNSNAPTAGATNTGGGGGGSGSQGNNTSYAAQTTGGSGIVVIRYQI